MRSRNFALGLTLLSLVLLVGPVRPLLARICSVDKPPAATLLLPYFEVDLANPLGRTTLFSINNASASATLVGVTVWSDLGVPTIWFPMYLTGYDVQTYNLRDLLINGLLPRTATAGQDPLDSISPKGDFSQDINYASCTGVLPTPALPFSFLDHLRKSLTGKSSPILEGCAGIDHGDQVARGYVTMDTINSCVLSNPSMPGYFGPGGIATNANILWGDFFLVDEQNNYAQGEDLVRLEADPSRFHPGDRTFYGRYSGNSAVDAREPLPSVWAARFLAGGAFTGGTDLLVWRDSGQAHSPFPCGQVPNAFPLHASQQISFDEQENVETFDGVILDPPRPRIDTYFPFATNRVKVSGPVYPVTFPFGWLYFDLSPDLIAPAGNPRQAWVGQLISAAGRFSVGYNATPLNSLCSAQQP